MKTEDPLMRITEMDPRGIAKLKRDFFEEGYLIVDLGFPEALLDEAAAIFQKKPHETNSVYGTGRIQDAWKFSKAVEAIALHPPAIELLREFYGRRPLPFQTLNFPVGTEQRAHSDTVHFNCWPNDGSMCGIWVALEDIDEDNGPLVYYPGSHKLPELFQINFGVPHGVRDRYQAYETKLDGYIRTLDLKPSYGTVKKGEAVLWAANLLHGGSKIKDPSRTRFSQATHYFFEGSQFYWTPLNSDLMKGTICKRNLEIVGKKPAKSWFFQGK